MSQSMKGKTNDDLIKSSYKIEANMRCMSWVVELAMLVEAGFREKSESFVESIIGNDDIWRQANKYFWNSNKKEHERKPSVIVSVAKA